MDSFYKFFRILYMRRVCVYLQYEKVKFFYFYLKMNLIKKQKKKKKEKRKNNYILKLNERKNK